MENEFENVKVRNSQAWNKLRKRFFVFLSEQARSFAFFVALVLFGYCVYIWYANIYSPDWSETRKQEYAKSKDQAVSFNKSGFEGIVSDFEQRRIEANRSLEDPVDIFRLKN
jgi:hypothetical protein